MDLTEYNSHMHVCFNLPVQRKCAIFGQIVEKVHIPSQLLEKMKYSSSSHPASVQFISVAQSCPTFCNPMNRSMPGLPVHHHLLEFTQTHVHPVHGAIQPSHPRSSPSPPAPNPSSIRVFSSESTLRMRWPK